MGLTESLLSTVPCNQVTLQQARNQYFRTNVLVLYAQLGTSIACCANSARELTLRGSLKVLKLMNHVHYSSKGGKHAYKRLAHLGTKI
jgi:hypothetical protein